ncbi:glycine--tRNA ligase subunit beta [Elioraea sp. Yellowstone]|jgi:glycyl-tRNA synthetase beta chain|uniref:glycine--tRNA ligase subunit beta n=1 Tax=Elioraea sp. Yellowstone TaxID=2592070 RepID=UPI0011547A00|nr:glycine--tRNA ligase subunit beta [Elioraea sp. Yellowstone]TQF77840.1 glycine--tRNA ligase subunit beta [Elioraea sp. Yellowstone]
MPELLLELLSEEIPARMQERAAEDLGRLVAAALAPLSPQDVRVFHGPRRLALVAQVAAGTPETRSTERGPRAGAPEAALAGFLRKHGASRDAVREEGGYLVLDRVVPAVDAATIIARELPLVLRRFPWPKSMRWGGTSSFAWVRPLRRILCILDGRIVPFALREGDDDGHGLAAGNETEGHRFMAPGAFAVASFADYRAEIAARHVILDAEERVALIRRDATRLAEAEGLSVVEDAGLVAEIAGLTEWPVGLIGRIDDAFMDLPPEVLRTSMRVNQRYLSLRNPDGTAAARFIVFANVVPADGGAAIVAGNERVLRARLADARFFWDQDRKRPLEAHLPKLAEVTFHARLGSQRDRVDRLVRLAGEIAPLVGADRRLAERAALLCKADLVTGMVGEFPELQGVMGRYYALAHGEDGAVANAIRDHYAPRGADDDVPAEPVSVALALADRIDTLAGFFAIGEKPTGSGDPFALRRATLGIIRIVRDNSIRIDLASLFGASASIHRERGVGSATRMVEVVEDLLDFLAERLRVQLRAEGKRHDIVAAVLARGADGDLMRVLARAAAIEALLGTEDGANLRTAYARAANILRIEEKKDGRAYDATPDPARYREPEERALAAALDAAEPAIAAHLGQEDFVAAMTDLASLRAPLDAFFDHVTVNAPEPALRENRLFLLARVRRAMDRVADFSKLEG